MAALIKDEFGPEAELVKGDGGILEVTVDGVVAFSNTGSCPEPESVMQKLR